MINFKKLRMKNILSYGNTMTEVDFSSHKSTLVVGKNGAGKSSFLEALTFALYGKPYRKINKSQMINSTNKKDLLVELELEIDGNEYLIRRGIKPNKFEYFKNGELVPQDAKVAEYQAKLEKEVLKMNFKSYSQIVVLGTATFTPFMELSAPDRRAVVEDLIGLEVFSSMNERLKEMVRDNKGDIRDNEHNLEMSELRQKAAEEKRAIVLSNTEEKRKNIIEKVNVILQDIEKEKSNVISASERMQTLEDDVAQLEALQAKRLKWSNIRSQLESKIAHTAKDADFFKHNDECPTCRQAIEESHKAGIIQSVDAKVQEVQDGLDKLNEQMAQMDADIADLQASKVDWDKASKDKSNAEMSIQIHKNSLKSLKRELEGVDKENKQVDVEDFKDHIRMLKLEREKLLKDKEVLASSAVLLKDGGIKAKVVSKYIPFINQSINSYLNAFEFYADFVIDENFDEKIRSRFRDDFSYFSFSQGERARIDISLMMTWRELARKRNSVATNIVIFDEVFDGSTDVEGVEALKQILHDDGTNVVVISHKTETHESHFDRVLRAEKVKGFTHLTEVINT